MKIIIKQSSLVQPAEDTPKKSLWICNLDLLVARIHFPTVYFYKPNDDDDDSSSGFFEAQVLKEALSKALVLFYPVAGRLGTDENGRIEIKCNGEGALFVEAETDFAIDDFKDFTPCLEFQKLVPSVDYSGKISSYPLLVLQVTKFKCGGMALGVGVHHTLADGASSLNFISIWANIARGITSITTATYFDRTLLAGRIPPSPKFNHIEYDPPPSLTNPISPPSEIEDISTATFNITLEQLAILKTKSKKDDEATKFSTYEILAAHIWRCACKARNLSDDQPTKLYIVTDGRFRLNPALPLGYFGNVLFTTTPISLSGDLKSEPLSKSAERIRKALKQMNDEYLKSALDYLEEKSDLTSLIRGASTFRSPNLNINSWIRLPVYDADFGWGRPIYMGPANVVYEGTIYMLPSPNNDGGLLLIVRLEANHLQLFKKLLYDLI